MNRANMPAAFEPPPTQATTASGSRPTCSRHCDLRLLADDRLEIPHDHRERVRADHAADRVMRRQRRAHPVAHRLVGRVAQGPRAGRDRHDRRAQGLHVEDVQLLPADVFLAHVDRALDAEQGAGRGRGHAVLARAGLGDHPGLVHPLGQHHLPDGVVDLVAPV